MDDLITLDDLERGRLDVVGLLPYASNYTLLAKLVFDDAPEALVVYKPRRGEAPLWDFAPGTLCRREAAAYLVSEALGWEFVPPTLLRDGPLGEGAVQLFVEHNPLVTAFDVRMTHPDDLKRIVLFDLLVNNADRKAGHVLLDAERRVWVVDHGICFHHQPKLRTVLWDFVGQLIPPSDRQAISRLCDALERDLGVLLSALLDPAEIDALRARADALSGAAEFPAPGPGRHYPWPMI